MLFDTQAFDLVLILIATGLVAFVFSVAMLAIFDKIIHS